VQAAVEDEGSEEEGSVVRPSRLLMMMAFLTAAGACAGGEPAPSARARDAAATPAASAPATTVAVTSTRITIAYATASAANSPLQLAQDQGIFRANGLAVDMVHAVGNAGPAAVLSGQAQVLSSGCAEAMGPVAGGADLVLPIVTINRMQYVLAGGPGISSPDSLRGKQLAVSRLGSSSHLATKFIVKYLGLDPEQDVTYVQVGNTPERVGALVAGNVDGAILSSDEGALIGNEPGMHVVVDMTREEIPYCGNALTTTRQYAREQPAVMRALTRSLVEAIARYKLNRPEGVEAVAHFLGESDVSRAELLWGAWVPLFPAKPYPEPRALQFVLDEMAQSDERARALVAEQIADPSWVRELDESGYIDSFYRAAGAR
jgi:ABC-type nitrate/sulfonate/bicarbonate transport system substrate-binding protein